MMRGVSAIVVVALLTSALPATAAAAEVGRIPSRDLHVATRLDHTITTLGRGRPPSIHIGGKQPRQRTSARSRFGPPSRKANAIAAAIVFGVLCFIGFTQGARAKTERN